MGDYGIKVLKPNAPSDQNVLNATPRYLTILSTKESHKVAMEGTIAAANSSVTHSLGFIPFFDTFYEESNGDIYPLGYTDDQYFDSFYATVTTSTLSASKYNKVKYYSIYFE